MRFFGRVWVHWVLGENGRRKSRSFVPSHERKREVVALISFVRATRLFVQDGQSI